MKGTAFPKNLQLKCCYKTRKQITLNIYNRAAGVCLILRYKFNGF
jgi:hypothetical protein